MSNTVKLLTEAARESLQDISEPYDDYHADLTYQFIGAIRIIKSVPGESAKRRAIEELVSGFSAEISAKLKES